MLQGSSHEQGARCLQETHDLNIRQPRELGREKIITRCKLCIPRDLAHRNQGMIHGELRKKVDAVHREEVFGVQEKALLLLRYVTKEMIEQRDPSQTYATCIGIVFDTDRRNPPAHRGVHSKNGGSRGERSCLFQA